MRDTFCNVLSLTKRGFTKYLIGMEKLGSIEDKAMEVLEMEELRV